MSSPIGGGRGSCALEKRDLALEWESASDTYYFNLLQAGYTRSTFNSYTKTVVVVINVRVSALTVFLNCFRSIIEYFFLVQISEQLVTCSHQIGIYYWFVQIANALAHVSKQWVQLSAVCTTANYIWLVDQNWRVDSHLNCQTLHKFSIIFHRVSHHIQNDTFNYEKCVYTHVYSINIWHWDCL